MCEEARTEEWSVEDAAPAAVVEDVADVTVHAEAERRGKAQRNKLLLIPTWSADERGEGSPRERKRVGLRPIPGKVTS